MKILFIVTQSEFGGAQRYIYEVAKYLSSQKYEVVVGVGEGEAGLMSNVKSQMSNLNIKCQKLRYLKRVPGPITALLSIMEVYKLLKKEGPNALFLCSTTAGILGSIAGFLYKKFHPFQIPNSKFQILYRIGGWAFRDPRSKWQNKIILWLEKLTASLKDKIIVNSEIDRQLALKYKIGPEQKIVKIYNGIDVNALKFLPKEKARKYLMSNVRSQMLEPYVKCQKFKLIGTIANFYKTKGLEHLIEAARILNSGFRFQVSPKNPLPNLGGGPTGQAGFRFIIIGDGRLRPRIERLIKKYKLEQTIFLLGRISDAYQYLKAFDIFVLPSVKEGFPWVILEAMSAEIPIVATKVGALAEIIENRKQGLLVEPANPGKLAEKIAWLLSHAARAQQMAMLARGKTASQFLLQRMLHQTEELLIKPL